MKAKALYRRLVKIAGEGLVLSRDLFGHVGAHEFEVSDYNRFLNNVSSQKDLVRGLKELSPFVDDALAVASSMNEQDFIDFKLALVHERKVARGETGGSVMPHRYDPLLVPDRFITAQMMSTKFETSLEVALGRIMETENGFA